MTSVHETGSYSLTDPLCLFCVNDMNFPRIGNTRSGVFSGQNIISSACFISTATPCQFENRTMPFHSMPILRGVSLVTDQQDWHQFQTHLYSNKMRPSLTPLSYGIENGKNIRSEVGFQ